MMSPEQVKEAEDKHPSEWAAFLQWDNGQTPFCSTPPLDRSLWIAFLSGWQCRGIHDRTDPTKESE